jgi:prolyl-tRNA synthetase
MPKKEFEEKKITTREEDYSQWYLDVIDAAQLAEHSPVKGCMVIKPYGYAIWEGMQKYLDERFKETGVENAYFPLFIPQSFLTREANHVEGFAPEVAVVTRAGGKELEEPLVVRPTSETIMYDTFSRWVHSYRDLPLLINQWANVVRWEMRTRLFLRTTEFLWQEGHTVHASDAEADERARMMLEVYRKFAEDILAIPVIPGEKTESERFAGAAKTYCLEAMMQDGKALQFATSHHLGQNFAKVFDVKFAAENGELEYGWQTSWGLSTRTIGALIMTHSDDKGLVLPPRLAQYQVVIVPIVPKPDAAELVRTNADELAIRLREAGLRVKVDYRDMRPGEKFFEWEKKGVPVRIELGPKDIAAKTAVVVRRDSGEKESVSLEGIVEALPNVLEDIQTVLFNRALEYRKEKTVSVDSWDNFKTEIEKGKFVMAHWSGEADVEAKIKEETNATIRCIPFDQPDEEGVCILSGKPSLRRVVFAKSY